MSTTYDRCPFAIESMMNELLCAYELHQPLLDNRVKIDLGFAMAERNEKTGEPVGFALKQHGVRALAKVRIIPLKDRVMGRGDAEILIDKDWWDTATEPEQRAVLDHELCHLEVRFNESGVVKDDFNRPKLQLRPHDYQIGWFVNVAKRHGPASAEVQQARQMQDESGQYFWPDLVRITEPPTVPA